ncbi:putative N-ethylmaleimide reductase [Halobacteriovorax marinus SJ]|uniref:N-ethylmaleimide reductase n=1 Tax=Halobacteriovorax marinus (strain ATCC BAA-682 / DSM 15412 / SJ) TaxID=862908 RepID=E1WYJ4_HALMS|nr:alkene reductase [Halobacteriovorax marinus]CBW26042.1 putative N-ethylmaleimide reductase [Halobacteriovorax marinus SJ]
MSALFNPLKLGSITLANRIIMAPLTRARATETRIPNDLMASYYRERARAGLILTEATSVTPMGIGYADTPGIWSKKQVEGWKKITKAVHDEGGKIFMQLWHVGRISHSSFLNGEKPVAPSAIKANGHVSLVRPITEYETPRALEIDEIKEIVEAYKQGAINAKEAGFDGVEIHAANGYLIDQFLQDSTNNREDSYGGSIENRSRFLLEVTDAAISVWGADRVGIHLAPRADAHDMGDSDLLGLFGHVVKELDKREVAFIFTREYQAEDSLTPKLRELFSGVFIGNEKYTREMADQAIESGLVDAVSFGLPFIANPDLVKRFEIGAPLNEVNPETLYAKGEEGYTDYPHL